jgi:hypothetical protein
MFTNFDDGVGLGFGQVVLDFGPVVLDFGPPEVEFGIPTQRFDIPADFSKYEQNVIVRRTNSTSEGRVRKEAKGHKKAR